jgi:hypothetical protein
MAGEEVGSNVELLSRFGLARTKQEDCETEISAILQEKWKDLEKEIIDTFNNLVSEATGAQLMAFIAIVITEFLNMGLGLAGAIVDNLINEFIQKGLGTLYAMLALVITAIEGFQLIITYLALNNLKKEMEKKMAISKVLLTDMRLLKMYIDKLEEFINDNALTNETKAELKEAIKFLNEAALSMAAEANKLGMRKGYSVSAGKVNSITELINDAMNSLTSDTLKISQGVINKIAKNYGLEGDTLFGELNSNGDDVGDILSFLTDISVGISRAAFGSSTKEDLISPDYDARQNNTIKEIDGLMSTLLGTTSELVKIIAMQEFAGSSVNRIAKHTPIDRGLIQAIQSITQMDTTITEYATDRVSPPERFYEATGIANPKMAEPAILTTFPDLTYARAIRRVDAAERVVLLAGPNWLLLEEAGMITRSVLLGSLRTVTDTRNEIQETVNDLATTSSVQDTLGLSAKKAAWLTRLSGAKSVVDTLSPPEVINIAGVDINLGADMGLQSEIKFLLETLEDVIASQNTNDDGSKKKSYGNIVIETSEKYLTPLLASQVVLLNKKISRRVRQGLISNIINLNKQFGEDKIVLDLCNTIIRKIESLSSFQPLMDLYNQLIGSMLEGTLTGSIADALRNGDLGGLTDILVAGKVANDVLKMLTCKEESLGDELAGKLKDIFNGDSKKVDDFSTKKGKAFAYLKNKQELLLLLAS